MFRKTEDWMIEVLKNGTQPECWFWIDDKKDGKRGILTNYDPIDNGDDSRPFEMNAIDNWYEHAEPYKGQNKLKCTVKAGQQVLVRDSEDEKWRFSIFSWFDEIENLAYPFYTIGNSKYACCIPFEGNESLLNTTNSPKEE